MKWIEILGPSGIGKTYFKNKLLSQNKDLQLINLENGLKCLAVSIQTNKNSGAINKFLRLYLNQNIIHSKKAMIIDNLLDYKKAYLSHAHSYNYLLEGCVSYYFGKDITAKEKVYRVSLFKSIIEKMTVFDYYEYDKTVIFDEGPFNHSHLLKNDFLKKDAILPKGFVFCDARPEVIYNRVKKRAKSGRMVSAHKDLSDKELYEHIETRYNNYKTRIDEFKKFGVPYILVDMEKEIDSAIVDVQQFLQENEISGKEYEE